MYIYIHTHTHEEGKRQILYNFTHMWNLKQTRKQTNEQRKENKNELVDTETKLVVTNGVGGSEVSQMGEGSIVW